jgi:hypothetical protein
LNLHSYLAFIPCLAVPSVLTAVFFVDGALLADASRPQKERVFEISDASRHKQQTSAVRRGRLEAALAVALTLNSPLPLELLQTRAEHANSSQLRYVRQRDLSAPKVRKWFDWGNFLESRLTGAVVNPSQDPPQPGSANQQVSKVLA